MSKLHETHELVLTLSEEITECSDLAGSWSKEYTIADKKAAKVEAERLKSVQFSASYRIACMGSDFLKERGFTAGGRKPNKRK
jgi:hypothetical protein